MRFFEKNTKKWNFMSFGLVKVATFSPEIRVGDIQFNTNSIKEGITLAEKSNVKILTFFELCLTGKTIGDLLYSKTLIDGAKAALVELANFTVDKNVLIFFGLPFEYNGKIYSACACLCRGDILAICPKGFDKKPSKVNLAEFGYTKDILFGNNVIFEHRSNTSLKIATEFGEELFQPIHQSIYHSLAGARIIVSLSNSEDYSGQVERRRALVVEASNKNLCGYIYGNAGVGESTTDNVYSGHSLIAECGKLLAENKPFDKKLCVTDIDLDYVNYLRSKRESFNIETKDYLNVEFDVNLEQKSFVREYSKYPFIVEGEEEYILSLQANALKKRLEHTRAEKIVLGLSGGLDSTLALIVAIRAIKLLNRPESDVLTVTMPCFGTSERTLNNSVILAKAYRTTLKKIDITKAVRRHLKDISHPETLHDAAYENAQARERTQVLMDLANKVNGLVLGTGDLSELALGWATYNGDHMSMYAVNGSIPKTLVRHLVMYEADNSRKKFRTVLYDIIDTPVSPELLPSSDNKIKQVTEDIVGPYVLHDFFLYSFIEYGYSPKKIYHVAKQVFFNEFDEQTILKWLKTFFRRFFSQQFKRSCLPDGVKATKISLSPRNGFRMPSDAVSKLWLDELENIK